MASAVLEAFQNKKTNPKTPFEFEKFSFQPIGGLDYAPFRENIPVFLQECAEIQDYKISGMPIWCTLLISEGNGVVFPLYTVEETVENSLNPLCDNCKFAGWGHHFVSKIKYHFIIPGLDQCKKQLKSDVLELRTHILYGLVHCNGFGHLICINERKGDSGFLADSHVMNFWDSLCSSLHTRKISVRDEMNLRLLYVVVDGQPWYGKWGYEFSQGSFGITKEQFETGVEYLKSLGLEKLVADFMRKGKGRKIRHIVDKYREVRDVPLSTLGDLLSFMMEFQSRARIRSKTENKMINSAGQNLVKRRVSEEPISSDKLASSLGQNCRWPAKKIKFVLNQIVVVLKINQARDGGKACISRQELRNEIRKCVGDTGLIDFVLKSITCFAMGNHIIRRSINSWTKKFEFKIHEVPEGAESERIPFHAINSDCKCSEEGIKRAAEVIFNISKANNAIENAVPRQELQFKARECAMNKTWITNEKLSCPKGQSARRDGVAVQDLTTNDITDFEEWDVVHDALYLCRNMLLCYSDLGEVSAVLNGKNLVKEWHCKEQDSDHLMALQCKVLPSFGELETELSRPLSPGEIVSVSPSMTISELKVKAQKALRETYCIMDKFVVSQIGGLKEIDPNKVVSCTIMPGEPVWVRGSGLDFCTKLRYEDGHKRLDVKCSCGTKYDDGERLAVCDSCSVYQHTRCRGIEDHEAAPVHFLCSRCDAILVLK